MASNPTPSDRARPSAGYVHCAHAYCFAVIIGHEGDLCEDCEAADLGSADGSFCNGCDNDSFTQGEA